MYYDVNNTLSPHASRLSYEIQHSIHTQFTFIPPLSPLTSGHDITTHVLACFGGAGPQHACAMARALGISRVFISRFSGILSAYGLSLADVVAEAQGPVSLTIIPTAAAAAAAVEEGRLALGSPDASALETALAAASSELVPHVVADDLATRISVLARDAIAQLTAQGSPADTIVVELYLNLRYTGTDSAIMTPLVLTPSSGVDLAVPASALTSGNDDLHTRLCAAIANSPRSFVSAYYREFGFVLRHRDIVVDDVRVRGIARGSGVPRKPCEIAPASERGGPPPSTLPSASVFFEEGGRQATPVYRLDGLRYGHVVPGPAIVIDKVCARASY